MGGQRSSASQQHLPPSGGRQPEHPGGPLARAHVVTHQHEAVARQPVQLGVHLAHRRRHEEEPEGVVGSLLQLVAGRLAEGEQPEDRVGGRPTLTGRHVRSIPNRNSSIREAAVITNPKFVGMYVEDQDRAGPRFWTEVVGWECPLDQPMGPGDDADRWIEVHPPAGGTYLVLYTPPDDRDRVGSFGPVWFDCDDLDATYTELKAKGVGFD